MKRIKIMLLSLIVLATLGGVLAFKVKEPNFCIYKKVGTTCPKLATIVEAVAISPGGNFTFLANNGNCPTVVPNFNCIWQMAYSVDD